MTIVQKRLILTPKAFSPLGSVPLRHEIAKLLDPYPDFDLLDIRLELEELEARYASKSGTPPSRSLDGTAPTSGSAKRFGGNLSEVADFGRKGFQMRLWEGSDDDSDEDSQKKNAGKPVFNTNAGPQGKEDQDQNSSNGVDAQRRSEWASSPLLPKTDEVETAILEVNRERLLRVQDEIKQTHVNFEEKFREEQRRATARFAQLEKEEATRRERAKRVDKQDLRLIAEARDQHLSVLLRDHEQRSQVEERAIRKEAAAEEARRREIDQAREQQRRAREEAEAEAKRKTEAEQEKAVAEAAKRKTQADAAAAAALKRAEEERKAKLVANQKVKQSAEQKARDLASQQAEHKAKLSASQEAAKANAAAMPKPRVSEQAARLEEGRLNKLKELEDTYKHLASDPALKKDFKVYERQLIQHLQQVRGTQEEVRRKSTDLIQLFRTPNGPLIQFLIVNFGAKILSQCEAEVAQPTFAFALAQVVVNVASQVSFVMESVLAHLHQVCILTVPKYYVFSKTQFSSDEAYYKALGYKEEAGKLESTADYVARMNVYMTFYAALTQTEVYGGVNPHGLGDGWSWCSRLLNRIPPNRLSARALEAFLKTAGFRLYQVYPKPFMKLMQAAVSEFLVNLKNHDDADDKAVVNRLETYVHRGQFRTSPKGRNMPVTDPPPPLTA